MFGIGFSEILIVLLVIIVFVRPDDLPKFLRTAGRLYGKAKKAYTDLVSIKDRIIKEIDETAALDAPPSRPVIAPPKAAAAPPAISPPDIPADPPTPPPAPDADGYGEPT
jgi:sec-independent protein translocase protein TatB